MNLSVLARTLSALGIMAVLPSCEVAPGQYGSGGYSGGYDDSPEYYSTYSSQPIYGSAGGYYSSGYSRPYYSSPYYGGPRYYRDYDRNHYSRYDNDHRSSSSQRSSNDNRRREEAIRLVKVREGSRGNAPEGFHSKEYFKNRGISLSRNTYETREGDRRGYTGGSGNKNKNHNNSSGNGKNDDKSDNKRGRR